MCSPGGSSYSSHHSGGSDRDSRALTEAPPLFHPALLPGKGRCTHVLFGIEDQYILLGSGKKNTLLIVNFSLIEKVGKTNRPFRFDLNRIPYNYTVEVTNRFKGLGLIDSA